MSFAFVVASRLLRQKTLTREFVYSGNAMFCTTVSLYKPVYNVNNAKLFIENASLDS